MFKFQSPMFKFHKQVSPSVKKFLVCLQKVVVFTGRFSLMLKNFLDLLDFKIFTSQPHPWI